MYLTSNNIPWKRYIFMQFWPPQTCVIWVMAVDISYKIDKDAMAWVRWFDVQRYLISVLLYYLYLCHLIYKSWLFPLKSRHYLRIPFVFASDSQRRTTCCLSSSDVKILTCYSTSSIARSSLLASFTKGIWYLPIYFESTNHPNFYPNPNPN